MRISIIPVSMVLLMLAGAGECFSQRTREGLIADPGPLHRAHHALTTVIVHDIFSPPVSSRIYAYTHIAAYEVLVQQDSGYQSLRGQIDDFPEINPPVQKISFHAAAVYAFLVTGKKLVFSEDALSDSSAQIMAYYRARLPKKIFQESLRYGEQVSEKILVWANRDRYADTRKMTRYNLMKQEGKWVPTPPVYLSAVEPNWKLMRPFILDSAAQFKPLAPPTFSREKESEFHQMAQYVYAATQRLNDEQRAIANFWDCNPFAVNVHGHVNYATKKLSPGGHWLSIAGIASQLENAPIVRTSAAYTLTAITLFDAFVSCWDEKYRSNLMRPESYINAYIDEEWRPMLQTPPFPEYTSGHSVISTASAIVLSHMFGNDFAFTDTSEIEYGYPARKFNSFLEACNEAAMSRVYGGIHYLPAIEQGQIQGSHVGNLVLKKLSFLRSPVQGSRVNSSSPGR